MFLVLMVRLRYNLKFYKFQVRYIRTARERKHLNSGRNKIGQAGRLTSRDMPTYFFVTPKKSELAKRIEEGLTRMIQDGSFDLFFQKEYGRVIAEAHLKERKPFKIDNPDLTERHCSALRNTGICLK